MEPIPSFKQHCNSAIHFIKNPKVLVESLVLALALMLFIWGVLGIAFGLYSFFHEPFLTSTVIFSGLLLVALGFASLISTFIFGSWVTLAYTQPQMSFIEKLKALPTIKITLFSFVLACMIGFCLGSTIGVASEQAVPLIQLLNQLGEGQALDGALIILGVVLGSICVGLVGIFLMALPPLALKDSNPFKHMWSMIKGNGKSVVFYALLSLALYFMVEVALFALPQGGVAWVLQIIVNALLMLFLTALWTQIYYPSEAPKAKIGSLGGVVFLLAVGLIGISAFFMADQHNQIQQKNFMASYDAQVKSILDSRLKRKALNGNTSNEVANTYYKELLIKPLPKGNEIAQSDIDKIMKRKPVDELPFFEPKANFTYHAEIINKYAPLTDKLLKATHSETLRPLVKEFSISSPLPNFIQSQHLMRLILAQSEHDIKKSPLLALENYLNLLRFGQDLRFKGALISDMVGIVIQSETAKIYLKLTDPKILSSEDAHALLKQWQALFQDQYMMKGVMLRESLMLNDLIKNPEGMWSINGSPDAPNMFLTKLSLPYLLYTAELSNKLYEKMDQVYSLPAYKNKALKKELAQLTNEVMSKNILMAIALPNFQGAQYRALSNRALLDTAYLKTALIAYNHAHQKYPSTLNQLIPEVIPELPLNPYTGKIYEYALKGKGYSLKTDYIKNKNGEKKLEKAIYEVKAS